MVFNYKNWQLYKDSYNLIGHINLSGFDGGDSLQRTNLFFIPAKVYKLKEDYAVRHIEHGYFVSLLHLEKKPGVFMRNPKEGPNCGKPGHANFACWSDTTNTSRDQLIGIIIGASYYEDSKFFSKPLIKRIILNFFRYQNGDLFGPVSGGCFVRSVNAFYLYPFLLVTDLFLLGSSLIHLYNRTYRQDKEQDWCGDFLNGLLTVQQAKDFMPTPISWLARKIFKKADPDKAFQQYFDLGTNNAPPFRNYLKPLVEAL